MREVKPWSHAWSGMNWIRFDSVEPVRMESWGELILTFRSLLFMRRCSRGGDYARKRVVRFPIISSSYLDINAESSSLQIIMGVVFEGAPMGGGLCGTLLASTSASTKDAADMEVGDR